MFPLVPETFAYDDVRISPRRQIGVHAQPTWEIALVTEGRGVRTLGAAKAPFAPGDAALVPPDVPHGWRFDPASAAADGRIANVSVTVNPVWLESAAALFPALAAVSRSRVSVVAKGGAARRVAALLKRMPSEPEAVRPLRVVEALLVFAAADEAERRRHDAPESPDAARLRRLDTFIVCNFRRPAALADAARELGMSRSAFCAFVRRATGRTFIDRLNDLRIEEAARRLKSTPQSVAEISAAVGFASPAYFNRQFRRRKGCTPREWRKLGS